MVSENDEPKLPAFPKEETNERKGHGLNERPVRELLQVMNEQAAPELRFKPSGLGCHHLSSIGDRHEVIERGGEEREGDAAPSISPL